jgi:hypothetical protein
VSKEDTDKKDLDKRVRALTTLTKDDEIPTLTADFFDSEHPLTAVYAHSSHLLAFLYFVTVFLTALQLTPVQGHQSLVSCPPLPEGGPIQADVVSSASEAPEAEESQDGDDAKDLMEGTSLTMSPTPTHSKEPSLDKKRKCVKELLSSSTSAPKNVAREASAPDDDVEIFDLLDS